MRVRNSTFTTRLVAICLMTVCSSTEASDNCSVADVLVDSWIRMARANVSAPPATDATRTEREFKAEDEVVLKGYSYSPALPGDGAITEDFVLLLPGSASSAAQLAETASRLALATRQEVFVYEYRGYASGSTARPTAASIQQDVDGSSIRLLKADGVVSQSDFHLVGFLAIQTLKHSRSGRSGNLRALVDSVPAQVPRIPFLISCPRWMNPLDAATADVVQRLGVLYGADDRWFKDATAEELMDKVRAGGGRVWVTKGPDVDLSPSGLAVRLPIYVDFVLERKP